MKYLTLPEDTATGDFVQYVQERMKVEEGLRVRYTFSGSVYFEHMKERGLYTTDRDVIENRIETQQLSNIYGQCLV